MIKVRLVGKVDDVGLCKSVPKSSDIFFIDLFRHPRNEEEECLSNTTGEPEVGDVFWIEEWQMAISEKKLISALG